MPAQTVDTSFNTATSGTTEAGIKLLTIRWQTVFAETNNKWTISNNRAHWGLL